MTEQKSNQSPKAAQTPPAIVAVDIYDQTYHLRGQDPEYIARLAETVDAKMRAVAARGTTVDSLRVAVLAALNIADELASMAEKYSVLSGSSTEAQSTIRSRTSSLAGLLDSVLGDERRIS